MKKFYADHTYYLFCALGLLGAFFSPNKAPDIGVLALLSMSEEILFRAWGQNLIEKRVQYSWRNVTAANMLISILFSLSHLASHPPVWALATFFPSIIFGIIWTRYNSLIACTVVHFVYNMSYFYL